MKAQLLLSELVLILLIGITWSAPVACADISAKWFAVYDGEEGVLNQPAPAKVVVDGSGNVYVTGGFKFGGTEHDYTTIKYDNEGDQLWVARYNGPASDDDQPRDLVVDESGNVYVTGTSRGIGPGLGQDVATVKYDANGNQVWAARYNGPDDDEDRSGGMAIDSSGSVYVALSSSHATNGFTTIKYDTDGNVLWVASHDGEGAFRVAVDDSGYVYVLGESYTQNTEEDIRTIKYDSNGNALWVADYNGPASLRDDVGYAGNIALDNSGNVYVAGLSGGDGTATDFVTIKYDNNGNELWVARYNNSGNGNDFLREFALDNFGNAYLTGESDDPASGISYATTVKYDTNGSLQWVQAVSDGWSPRSCAVNNTGGVYVAGGMRKKYRNEFKIVKYDDNGNKLWERIFNGQVVYEPVTADNLGNAYVFGDYAENFLTIKLNPDSLVGPIVDFSSNTVQGENPLTVEFSDLTVGEVDSWYWDFDGDLVPDSFEQNPSYTFTELGLHSITLQVKGADGTSFLTKENYISVAGVVIYRIKHRHCYPGERIKIVGAGFGEIQGDSVVHINRTTLDSTSRKIKVWTDTLIKVKIPFGKKDCSWFKHDNGQCRKRKVWVTVGGVESNIKRIEVLNPNTCP